MSKLYINTTQNIPLYFTPASVGERMLAYLIDLLIKIAYITIVSFVLFKSFNIIQSFEKRDWSIIALIILLSLPLIFYSLISESMMEGQTFGKKVIKIRVIKIDGFEAGFFDFFLRWIFRIIDIDMMDLPGLVSMISTKNTQRLGDLAAGTAVITEKAKYHISQTILMDIDDVYKPYFTKNQVLLFSDNDVRIIKENAHTAIVSYKPELLNKLTTKIESILQLKNPFKTQKEFINTLLKDYNYFTGQ